MRVGAAAGTRFPRTQFLGLRKSVHIHVESGITKGKYHDYDTFLGREAVEYPQERERSDIRALMQAIKADLPKTYAID